MRDRDATFTRSFDDVFRSEGVRVVRTPVRAPRANANAERWVGTARRECLDWLLILGRRHLERVLREYIARYNTARPHQAFRLRAPLARSHLAESTGEIVRRRRRGAARRDLTGIGHASRLDAQRQEWPTNVPRHGSEREAKQDRPAVAANAARIYRKIRGVLIDRRQRRSSTGSSTPAPMRLLDRPSA